MRDVFARDKFYIPIDVPTPLNSSNPGLDEKQYREQQPYCHDFLRSSSFRFVDALVEWKFERAFDVCSDSSTAELGNVFWSCIDTCAELHPLFPTLVELFLVLFAFDPSVKRQEGLQMTSDVNLFAFRC